MLVTLNWWLVLVRKTELFSIRSQVTANNFLDLNSSQTRWSSAMNSVICGYHLGVCLVKSTDDTSLPNKKKKFTGEHGFYKVYRN